MAEPRALRNTLGVGVLGVLVAVGAAVAVAVSGGAAAPARDALLRPGVGAGKLRLGMTFTQVRSVLGTPVRVERRERYGFRGDYVQYVWGVDEAWQVGVVGERAATARVVLIHTWRPERTRAGVGVGSTHATLQRRLRARCYRQRSGPAIQTKHHDFVVCYLGRSERQPITSFGLLTECTLPRDRYSVSCPSNRRRYRAADVTIVSVLGQRILGGPCRFERAFTERCD